MAEAAWLLIPACLVGAAFMFHGFNFITINKHYYNDQHTEKDDERP